MKIDRSPYVGLEMGPDGKAIGPLVPDAPHMLMFAGSGTGKSRRVLVPQIMMWDGPVCAVSAKSDLAEMSSSYRARRGGTILVMDLTGQADWSQIPEDAVRLTNDPCALLVPDASGSTDDSALELAELLTELGTLGSGGSGDKGGDSAFWATLAIGTLSALIQAGSFYLDQDGELQWGGGVDWVLRAALDLGPDEVDLEDLTTPNWNTVFARTTSIGSQHAAEVMAAKGLDPRQRDSVSINLRVALSNWKRRSVRGTADSAPFTPDLLEDRRTTLYLISPSTGGAAAAAASVIESLVAHWERQSHARSLPPIAMVIDECPSICPLPKLDRHLNVMRSYGMHFSVAAQGSSQYEKKFGKAWAQTLLDTAPAILLGIGALEKDLLDKAAWSLRPSERKVEQTNVRGGQSSMSSDATQVFTSAELLPRHMGEGRLLVRGLPGHRVKLADYTDMMR